MTNRKKRYLSDSEKEQLSNMYDPEEIIDILGLDTHELVDILEDQIVERIDLFEIDDYDDSEETT